MMEKVPKQQSIEIWHIPVKNDDTINAQIDNTGKISVALQF